ncbi:hypothetical protein [Microbulbifer rhizosphaerae]|uniref:Uncharacterized protein n=1 Tax=Microbulbifer rhizosphaerae TaxID=1562603 RepID=A0A7W4ZA42_9GAMM|nr:hypothetical protein [Microbulbifer rhizosphaerae]MBB3060944.1 hypothetical protein [Microbulbifer rhizosphaerae]
MPEIAALSSLLFFIACALVFIDCYAFRKKLADIKEVTHHNERLSDLVLFVPFAALFYTENFWSNLGCTLPIILAVAATQWTCYKKGWLDSPPELITLAPGSYLLTVIAYFVFFHEGVLVDSSSTPEVIPAETSRTGSLFWLDFWPYAVYLVCFLLAITRRSMDGIFLSALLLILAITILPFFTGYYWWAMLAGLCVLLLTSHRAFNVMEPGTAGAYSLVSSLFYMIAAFGSMLTYGILF